MGHFSTYCNNIDGSVAKNILQYIAIQYLLQHLVQNVLSGYLCDRMMTTDNMTTHNKLLFLTANQPQVKTNVISYYHTSMNIPHALLMYRHNSAT